MELMRMSNTEHLAPVSDLAPVPPVREASGAQPLPEELQSRLDEILRHDVGAHGHPLAA
jgi:hypothetical protein